MEEVRENAPRPCGSARRSERDGTAHALRRSDRSAAVHASAWLFNPAHVSHTLRAGGTGLGVLFAYPYRRPGTFAAPPRPRTRPGPGRCQDLSWYLDFVLTSVRVGYGYVSSRLLMRRQDTNSLASVVPWGSHKSRAITQSARGAPMSPLRTRRARRCRLVS